MRCARTTHGQRGCAVYARKPKTKQTLAQTVTQAVCHKEQSTCSFLEGRESQKQGPHRGNPNHPTKPTHTTIRMLCAHLAPALCTWPRGWTELLQGHNAPCNAAIGVAKQEEGAAEPRQHTARARTAANTPAWKQGKARAPSQYKSSYLHTVCWGCQTPTIYGGKHMLFMGDERHTPCCTAGAGIAAAAGSALHGAPAQGLQRLVSAAGWAQEHTP